MKIDVINYKYLYTVSIKAIRPSYQSQINTSILENVENLKMFDENGFRIK